MLQTRLRTTLQWIGGCLGAWLLAACAGLAPAPTPTPTVDLSGFAPEPRVSLVEAKTHFDAGTALFLDVRSEAAYAATHIEGAQHIPLTQVEARFGELPGDQLIITYCA